MNEIFNELVKAISDHGIGKVLAGVLAVIIIIVAVILSVLLYILIYSLLKKIVHRLFKTLRNRKGNKIHIEFLERMTNFSITVIAIISFLGWENLGRSLLGSAAVLTGVIGFAAQDVIKDILSGLLISFYKPFDLGDRIELEDGTVGIVESITMRHVVIVGLDTLRIVIPNSKINAASIKNYSFGKIERSCVFKFPVGYESDIEKTKQIISNAIMSSPYSIPGKRQKDRSMDYGDIYFIDLADSALIMAVTVYYEAGVSTEKMKDDINTRVFEALGENGIEVPYNYSTVVLKRE